MDLCFLNIKGLFSRCDGTRTCKLELPEILAKVGVSDFILLVETWNSSDTVFPIPNDYYFFQSTRKKHPRARRNSGGLLFFFKTELQQGIKLLNQTHPDVMWVKLDKHFYKCEKDIFICLIYVSCDNRNTADFLNNLTCDILVHQLDGEVVIVGDLNARTYNLPGLPPEPDRTT